MGFVVRVKSFHLPVKGLELDELRKMIGGSLTEYRTVESSCTRVEEFCKKGVRYGTRIARSSNRADGRSGQLWARLSAGCRMSSKPVGALVRGVLLSFLHWELLR